MICYRDRQWCSMRACQNAANCDQFFSEEDRVKAIKWWGSEDFPLCTGPYYNCQFYPKKATKGKYYDFD